VIDSEAAYAMAPRANQLMVDGDECDKREHGAQALFNAMLAPLTGKGSRASAAIESVSYGLPTTTEGTTPASQLKVSHAIALRAAAEGVSLLVSSGDAPGVEPPASDPDLTAVGGTTLGIGAHNKRVLETGWSTAFGERTGTSGPWQDKGILLAASGGVSTRYGEPGYQQGVVPSSMALNPAGRPGRTVPDIAADADPATGMLFGLIVTHANGKTTPYTPYTNAGTSMAAPLIAGIVADAEQGESHNLGFLNPLLYSLAGTPAYHDILPLSPSDPQIDRAFYEPGLTEINHKFARGFLVGVNDAQDPGGTDQVTAPGYDTMTGLGTPNGSAFIKALRSGN
jgi:subtilase family serine protease